MSVSHSKFVMSKPISATLNGKSISIFHQSPIAKNDAAWRKAEAAVARSSKKLEYGICAWIDSPEERIGALVVRIPESHTGVSTEYMDEDLEAVGTLLKKGRTWYVETDEQVVEIMRRNSEVNRMKEGQLSISIESNGGFCSDHEVYAKYLSEKDKAAGQMITRGHGVRV